MSCNRIGELYCMSKFKRFFSHLSKIIYINLMSLILIAMHSKTVLASDFGWLGEDSNTFGELEDKVKSHGVSFFQLLFIVGTTIISISLIVCGLRLKARNAQKREEGKVQLYTIFFGGAVFIGIFSIVSFIQAAASLL